MLQKILLPILPLLLFACTKESNEFIPINEPNPDIPPVPAITLDAVSKTQVKAYQDSLVFTIGYIDGDGDLGDYDADETSIELVDMRNPDLLLFKYHLQPLAPDTTITIKGQLDIVLDHTILLDENNTNEITTFTLRLKDRTGNWSNTVETEPITIQK